MSLAFLCSSARPRWFARSVRRLPARDARHRGRWKQAGIMRYGNVGAGLARKELRMSRPGHLLLAVTGMVIVSGLSLAACRARPSIDPADAPIHAKRVPQASSSATGPREVPLWPEGSRQLQEAARVLACRTMR